uniref:F-box domain-containing protein n=1 Tax=Panagrellus redivivus TaxID=6233 RepID=A0A7E4VNP8_PANRE
MTHAFNNNTIKRFTYDWLIRFAELHPFEICDYEYNFDILPGSPYNPLYSNYAAISPMFTTLITRHMPYIFHDFFINILNGAIQNDVPPTHHRYKIYVCYECQIDGRTTPGMLSLLETNRIIIYTELICTLFSELSDHTLTPNELKYLLKFGPRDRIFQICGVLSEPFEFAELWPLLQHCKEIRIELKNLIYDENVATVLKKHLFFPNEICFLDLQLPDKTVLEMFDYFLSLPKFPKGVLFQFQQLKPVELRKAITKKLFSVGFQNDSQGTPENPFNIICCVNGSKFDCTFDAGPI